ncbi:unnamed protein product [Durusdinium trenchii]|uniref:Endonuclease/exonuclease/phosphatase domain-containing protein n=1 Tax=Durusdinium trenchii TaxID=1381693 RepID=A0ABP0P9G8_9DINO
MSVELEEAWKDLKLWLWAVNRYANAVNGLGGQNAKSPPIIVIGTKFLKRKFDQKDLRKRVDDFITRQMPGLRQRLQGFICLDNFSRDIKQQMHDLRSQLHELTMQVLTTEESWKEKSGRSDVPPHIGLQAEAYPLAWIQAHELLSDLDGGVTMKVSPKQLREILEVKGDIPKLQEELAGTHVPMGHHVIAPAGSAVRRVVEGREEGTGLQQERSEQWSIEKLRNHLSQHEESVSIEVSCDFLTLDQVKALLAKMRPKPLSGDDVTGVLQLMHDLGVVFWLDEDDLRETVALNVRKLSLALSALIGLRYWDECKFEHSEAFLSKLQGSTQGVSDDVLRFQTSGIASTRLLECAWEGFTELQQKLMLEVMLRKGLLVRRAVLGEYAVPSCLPLTFLAEPPCGASSAVVYVNLEGFVSAVLFPKIVEYLCEKKYVQLTSPPQAFRNYIELRSDDVFIIMSLASVAKQRLLRIQAIAEDSKAEEASQTAKSLADAFSEALGLKALPCTNPSDSHKIVHLQEMLGLNLSEHEHELPAHVLLQHNPCLNLKCFRSCDDCARSEMLSLLLNERFLPNLGLELRQIISSSSLQKFSRPFGSFRFDNVWFPGDVDIEEYVVVKVEGPTLDAEERKVEALKKLSEEIQRMCKNIQGLSDSELVQCYWSGLKAGVDISGRTLTWTADEVVKGTKDGVPLHEALRQGHRSWTAKVDLFAKVNLFADVEGQVPHFREVTNVIRFGYRQEGSQEGSHIIHPVTQEKDFLKAVQDNIRDYSSAHPKAMKYVKRLWERSAFMAQRGFHCKEHFQMLEALKPIFRHWAAQLAQISAHAETLLNMLESTRVSKNVQQQRDAIEDLNVLGSDVEVLYEKCQSLTDDPAAEEGVKCLQEVLDLLDPFQPYADADVEKVMDVLKQVEELMSCCVELVIINWLGDRSKFTSPVSKALQDGWVFPSDHLPIGCSIMTEVGGSKATFNVASWNVLNQRYMKDVLNDAQGLKCSSLATQSVGDRKKVICTKVVEMLEHSDFHKHILCLQGCWPALLDLLDKHISSKGFLLLRWCKESPNQEAMIVDTKMFDVQMPKDLQTHHVFKSDQGKAVTEVLLSLKNGNRKFRIVTTHLPGKPFGTARREFCDFIQKRKEDHEAIPTILAGDLNFPEEAIRPLLNKRDGKMENVKFVPIPYPTNICQGSLLPKRIDCIALLSGHEMVKVKPLSAENVLPGLADMVKLLESRSWELAEVKMDMREQAYQARIKHQLAEQRRMDEEKKMRRAALARVKRMEEEEKKRRTEFAREQNEMEATKEELEATKKALEEEKRLKQAREKKTEAIEEELELTHKQLEETKKELEERSLKQARSRNTRD